MKKLSISLLVMLLIASLFTSCSMGSDDASDVRVKVRLTPSGGGRSLTTDIETINLDDDSITWHYSATKVSETQFNYGATSDSILPKDGIVTLSQGEWSIGLWGIKDGKEVYTGTTNNVTIKWNFYEPNVTVTVPVKQNTGDNGYIVLNNVLIYANDEYKNPNYASIVDNQNNNKTEILNLNGANMRIECAPGSHTITFEYRNNNSTISSKSLVVTVISGRETTISGNIEKGEITNGASSAPTSDVQVIEVKKEAEVKVETSVAPATTSTPGTNTTVTFPAGSFNDNSSNAVLNLSVKSEGSEFSVTSSSTTGPVAGIDISLKVNGDEVKEFNGKEVVIETYIEKDLTNVSVRYNGDGDQPIASDDDTAADKTVAAVLTSSSPATALGYNPDTGLLRFKTNHFSEYYVLADVEAVNVSTGICYSKLVTAINSAQDNSTIKLLADVITPTLTYYIENKNLTLDLNGKTLSGSGYDGTLFVGSNATLTINGEGNVIGNDDQDYGMAIWAYGSNANVIINGGKYSNTLLHDDKQMDMIYASNGGKVVINGGEFNCITPKWTLNVKDADYNNGTSTITVTGGKFHGFDPANCESEGIGTSFIEDWCISNNIGSEAEAIYEVGPDNSIIPISSDEDLASALESASDDKIIIYLTEGNFTLPSGSCQNKNVRIVGSGFRTVLNILPTNELAYQNGATLVFKDMTINGQNGGNYGGLAHTNKVTYNNCKMLGKITLYAGVEKFINCTFENKNDYAIWTWGGKKVTLTGCTFNSGGKAVLLYGGAGSSETPTTVLTVTDCIFNDDNTLNTDKAAIETGNDYGATYILNVTNPTVNGFAINPEGKSTGTTLWANKNSMDAAHLTVTIDGNKVQ